MTGRERILAALSPAGTDEVPAVVCYPTIYTRDHFAELSAMPWWTHYDPRPEVQTPLLTAQYAAMGIDWFGMGPGPSRAALAEVEIVAEGGRAFRVDRRAGTRAELAPPVVSGTLSVLKEHNPVIDDLDAFLEARVPMLPPFAGLAPGEDELPTRLAATLGREKFGYYSVGGPQWSVSSVLGYEQWFEYLAIEPEPVFAAARRCLHNAIQRVRAAAACGCDGVWIEDCMTDLIGPARFARYNLPLLQELVQAIRDAGMSSVYYFCGNPWPVFDLLLATGADAVALEEGKKDFAIDIDDVVARVGGRMAVLGNLDAIAVLEQGTTAELRREIARQLAAGRRNGGRFIMSTGSPATPGTPPSRLREYVALVRELSAQPV